MFPSTNNSNQITDYARWTNPSRFSDNWEKRAEFAIKNVLPRECNSVLDIGCGPKNPVPKFLPSTVYHVPADIQQHNRHCILIDLNAPQLPFVNAQDNYHSLRESTYNQYGGYKTDPIPNVNKIDCIVFFGVLEYIDDIPRLVKWLRKFGSGTRVLLSYSCTDEYWDISKRRSRGWISDYSDSTLKQVFKSDNSFILEKEHLFDPFKQRIYLWRIA